MDKKKAKAYWDSLTHKERVILIRDHGGFSPKHAGPFEYLTPSLEALAWLASKKKKITLKELVEHGVLCEKWYAKNKAHFDEQKIVYYSQLHSPLEDWPKKIHKVTVGYVVQVFDTEKGKFVSQQFVASKDSTYEDAAGNPLEEDTVEFEMMPSPTPALNLNMVQPEQPRCKRCGSKMKLVTGKDRCSDKSCPYSDHPQTWDYEKNAV